jgi:hypothetical protein
MANLLVLAAFILQKTIGVPFLHHLIDQGFVVDFRPKNFFVDRRAMKRYRYYVLWKASIGQSFDNLCTAPEKFEFFYYFRNFNLNRICRPPVLSKASHQGSSIILKI